MRSLHENERNFAAKTAPKLLITAHSPPVIAGRGEDCSGRFRPVPSPSLLRNQPRRGISVACLVSLFDGRMIWCNVRVDAWDDLRVPANARTAIYELLSGLDPAPQAPGKK